MSSNRSAPQLLEGANLPANTSAYIFLLPESGPTQVTFTLDNGAYTMKQALAPWDFADGYATQAYPWKTGSAAQHTITTQVTEPSNNTTLTTNFRVGTPPQSTSEKLQIYTDKYASSWRDGSFSGTFSLSNTEQVYSGSKAIKAVVKQGTWGGVSPTSTKPIAVSPYAALNFAIYSADSFPTYVALEGPAGYYQAPQPVSVIANKWNLVSIPMGNFGIPTGFTLTRIYIKSDASARTFWVDEIGLGAWSETKNVCTAPSCNGASMCANGQWVACASGQSCNATSGSCYVPQFCTPGAVQSGTDCNVCNSNGSAYAQINSKCASNQTCNVNGTCVTPQLCSPGSVKANTTCLVCNANGSTYAPADSKCPSGQICNSAGACYTPQFCLPGTVQSGTTCNVCNAAGSAYTADNNKCASGQLCNADGNCYTPQFCTPGSIQNGTQCSVCNAAGAAYSPNDASCQAGQTCDITGICISPPPTGTNLALNKPVYASSIENSKYPASYAVDGSTSTRWSSQFSDPQWLYVDLGNVYAVNGVVLNWELGFAASYKIDVSYDALTWTNVYSKVGGIGWVETDKFTPTNARYVRFYGTSRGTPWSYSLWEFQVFGTNANLVCTPGGIQPGTSCAVCNVQGSGYSSSSALCPSGQTCNANGTCIMCTPGSVQNGTTCNVCNAAGSAYASDSTKCAAGQTCNAAGACVAPQFCTPGTVQSGTTCNVCNSAGSAYTANASKCASGQTCNAAGACVTTNQTSMFKVMALGDSITDTTCYPPLVMVNLNNAGYAYNKTWTYIGTHLTNTGQGITCNGVPYWLPSEGHSAYLSSQVARDLPGWLATNANAGNVPDIVYLHIGTNDIGGTLTSSGVTSILSYYTSIVNILRTSNPNVKILVAQIIPRTDTAAATASGNLLDDAIPAWVASTTTAQSPVTTVDLRPGFVSSWLPDGVHPNVAGSQFMADKVAPALIPLLGGAPPAPICTSGAVKAGTTCLVCNTAGSAYAADSTKCASGQTCNATSGACYTPPKPSYSIVYSMSPDRSSPKPLEGANLPSNTNVYIYLTPDAGPTQVVFTLDTGYTLTQGVAPWDFADGVAATAYPWSTSSVSTGAHTLTTKVTDGTGTATLTTKFNVTFVPICTPGTVQNGTACNVCNANGSAYVPTNSKCSAGQTCSSAGSCITSICTVGALQNGTQCNVCNSQGTGYVPDYTKCAAGQSCVSGNCTTLPSGGKWITAYYAGWMQSYLPASAIDYTAMTHIQYFAGIPNADGTINLNSNGVPNNANQADLIARAHAAGVKVTLTVGGWNTENDFMSATSAGTRTTFINNLVAAMQAGKYDGLDIDWEPLVTDDQANYVAFSSELRAALDKTTTSTGERPMLTMATQWAAPVSAAAAQYYDQINLMTYDLAGLWPGWVTWHNSALYNDITIGTQTISANGMVDKWNAAGVPLSKLGIGIDWYGYKYSGVTGPRQAITGGSLVQGNRPYSDIMKSDNATMTRVWDSAAQAVYLTNSAGWITYDDEQTIQAKADYVKTKGIGGVIIWELGGGYLPSTFANRDRLLQAVKNSGLK